jgi:hypothetical protein
MNAMGNDRDAPATKGDLEDLEIRLNGEISGLDLKIDGVEIRLKGEMSERKARLTEKMRDMQTKLLHAFLRVCGERAIAI